MLNLSSSSAEASETTDSPSFSFRSHTTVGSLFGSLDNANEESVLAQRIGQGCFILLYAALLIVLIWGAVEIIRWRRVRQTVLAKYRLLAKSAGVISKFAVKRPASKQEESKRLVGDSDRKPHQDELTHQRHVSSLRVRAKTDPVTSNTTANPSDADQNIAINAPLSTTQPILVEV
jgi:hypothetical protein